MQIQLLEEQDIFYRHLLSTLARIAACCTSVARAMRCKAEHAGQYLHTDKTATRTSRSCSRWELRLCGADLLLTSHCHYTVSQLLVAARSSVSCDVHGSICLFVHSSHLLKLAVEQVLVWVTIWELCLAGQMSTTLRCYWPV